MRERPRWRGEGEGEGAAQGERWDSTLADMNVVMMEKTVRATSGASKAKKPCP